MGKYSFYDAYKLRFIHDESRPTLSQFAKKHGIEETHKFQAYAKQQQWEILRDRYWAEVAEDVKERMKGLQVHDATQKLREIQALKARAWEEAFNVEFKTADKAISSYTELEKLERLILGQSTDNITVQQLDAYLLRVVTVIKEEVTDVAALTRIRERLSKLTLGDVTDASSDMLSN